MFVQLHDKLIDQLSEMFFRADRYTPQDEYYTNTIEPLLKDATEPLLFLYYYGLRSNSAPQEILEQHPQEQSLTYIHQSRMGYFMHLWAKRLNVQGLDLPYALLSLLIAKSIQLTTHTCQQANTAYINCKVCGAVLTDDDINSAHICESCQKEFCYTCEKCGDIVFKRDTIRISEHYDTYPNPYCRSCAQTIDHVICDGCNRWIQAEDEVEEVCFNDGSCINYCPNCIESSQRSCRECGYTDFYQNMMYDDEYDEYFCPSCYEEKQAILAYNYKPNFTYHTAKTEGKRRDDTLYLGFELEVERGTSLVSRLRMANLIKKRYKFTQFYVMHDGSLQDGIEIVAHPFTWSFFKQNVDLWDDLLMFIRSHGWVANVPTVGFHVHMSKAAFSPMHLYKFVKFIYRAENKAFITEIAGRDNGQYAPLRQQDAKHLVHIGKYKDNYGASNHYHAINLQTPDTVECRIFAGALEPLLFYKNIEFLVALYRFTDLVSPRQLTERKFLQYVHKNRRKFPCLLEYLKLVDEDTNNIYVSTPNNNEEIYIANGSEVRWTHPIDEELTTLLDHINQLSEDE